MISNLNFSVLQRRLIKNSGFNFVSLLATSLASFLASVIVARFLRPDSAGVYFYLMWLVGTISLITYLGVPNSVTRFIAEAWAEKNKALSQVILSRSTVFVLIWGGVVGLTLLALGPSIPIPELARPYLWLVPLASLSLALQTVYGGGLLGIQNVKSLAAASLIGQPLLVVSLLLVSQTGQIEAMIGVTAASYLVTLVIMAVYFYRAGIFWAWPTLDWSEVKKRFIKYASIVSFISLVDAIVWQRSETFFLGIWNPSADVAFYTLGFGLAGTAMKLLPGAFSGILLPTLTETHLREEKWVLRRRFYRAVGVVTLLVIPVVTLGWILSPLVIPLLYGPGYQDVITVFRIVLIGSGIGAVSSVPAALLYSAEKPRIILIFGLVAAVINIALDIYLIRSYGLVGAAWANTLAQLLGVIGGWSYVIWSLKD